MKRNYNPIENYLVNTTLKSFSVALKNVKTAYLTILFKIYRTIPR